MKKSAVFFVEHEGLKFCVACDRGSWLEGCQNRIDDGKSPLNTWRNQRGGPGNVAVLLSCMFTNYLESKEQDLDSDNFTRFFIVLPVHRSYPKWMKLLFIEMWVIGWRWVSNGERCITRVVSSPSKASLKRSLRILQEAKLRYSWPFWYHFRMLLSQNTGWGEVHTNSWIIFGMVVLDIW